MGGDLRCTGLFQNPVVCMAGNVFFYFFMTLMPAVWGEQYYFLGPVFILLLLLAGSMVFTHVILRKVFRMEKWSSLAIQAVITIAEFMFIYSAQSGFYWYNGGIHYVGMHGFGLLFCLWPSAWREQRAEPRKVCYSLHRFCLP